MDKFTRNDLRELLENTERPCVSLFLPTHRAGRDTREDPIRCKNLLTQAEAELASQGLSSVAIRRMLAPAWDLQDGSRREFWQHQSDCLAMFIDPTQTRHYRVPLKVEEALYVGDQYFVKPLLPLLDGNGRFYLLAVSQNQVRFFEGNRFSIRELRPEHLPKNMADALNIDEYFNETQPFSFLSAATGGADTSRGIFYGQGAADMGSRKGDELTEYFHRLDGALQEYLSSQRVPLVFAGVDYLFPIFKRCSHYNRLLDTHVTGNPDQLSAEQLHQRAWAVVEPQFHTERQAALSQYGERAARNLASDDLQEIVIAAREGAIDVLLLEQGASIWGTVDENSGEIHDQAERSPETRDLLDYAASHTLINSGAVYVIEPEAMPTQRGAGAILRYPITWPASSS